MSLSARLRARFRKPPPDGWNDIEPTLEKFEAQWRKAKEAYSMHSALLPNGCEPPNWHVFRLHYERTRYIYNLFYKEAAISSQLYTYCLDADLADPQLIKKWKQSGFANLCCLRCIQTTSSSDSGTKTCACRLPKLDDGLDEGSIKGCVHCGCLGCSG